MLSAPDMCGEKHLTFECPRLHTVIFFSNMAGHSFLSDVVVRLSRKLVAKVFDRKYRVVKRNIDPIP